MFDRGEDGYHAIGVASRVPRNVPIYVVVVRFRRGSRGVFLYNEVIVSKGRRVYAFSVRVVVGPF